MIQKESDMQKTEWLIYAVFALAITLVAIASCADAQLFDWSPRGAHHQSACSVRSGSSGGSGVYVDFRGLRGVLTAAHVVGARASVRFPNGEERGGDCRQDKFGADIAFVFIDAPTIPPLSVAAAAPEINDRVELVGWGGPKTKLRHLFGRQLRGWSETSALYSYRCISGDSGGGVLNDQHQVIGINCFGTDGTASTINGWTVYTHSGGPAFSVINRFLSRLHGSGFR
jgi:S1-C subfamily serine protease